MMARKRFPLVRPSHSASPAPAENPPTATRLAFTRQRANAAWSARSTKRTSFCSRVHVFPAAEGATITRPGTSHAPWKAQRPPDAPPLPAPCSASRSARAGERSGRVTRMSARRPGATARSYSPGAQCLSDGMGRDVSFVVGGEDLSGALSLFPVMHPAPTMINPIATTAQATPHPRSAPIGAARPERVALSVRRTTKSTFPLVRRVCDSTKREPLRVKRSAIDDETLQRPEQPFRSSRDAGKTDDAVCQRLS